MALRYNYTVVPIAGTPNSLILGLTWATVLGQDLAKEALRIARRSGATHYTQNGERSTSVGFFKARGRERRAQAGARFFSAAAAFASQQRHGTHIAYIVLPDKRIWIAVSVDGVVQTGSDVILADEASAQKVLADAQSRFSAAQLHSSDIEHARPLTLRQLTSSLNDQTVLQRAAFKLSMIPPVWLWAAGLAAVYLAWDTGYGWWQAKQAAELESQKQFEVQVNPQQIWSDAIDTWLQATRSDGQEGLQQYLAAADMAPVAPGRWRLEEIDCRPAIHTCTAIYSRTRLADNNTLLQALPKGWKLSWNDLDTATVQWAIPERKSVLTLDMLPDASQVNTVLVPGWQGLRPALQDLALTPASEVGIRAPNIQLPNGLEQPVSRPADLNLPWVRQMVINGPLRSLYTLQLPASSAIEQLQIRYQPDASPTLVSSQFNATLRGAIYVQAP